MKRPRSGVWWLSAGVRLAAGWMVAAADGAASVMPEANETASVAVALDRRCRAHAPGPSHPERPARLDAVERALAAPDLAGRWRRLDPRLCGDEWILAVHSDEYLRQVAAAVVGGRVSLPTGDTDISPDSLTAARAAAGAALAACDAVMAGAAVRAFCAVRPPGHHATRDRGMGFCVFNNVAIAARYLHRCHGLKRILIVDWDVHHGNGTYDIFRNDPSVFQFHLHQRGLYPGTGSEEETGEGAARGQTICVPLQAGAGAREMLTAIDARLAPAMRAFRPEFVLVSAGFDAHRDDPLGGLRVASEEFGRLTERVCAVADEHAGGRLVSVLEGGYDLRALEESVAAHLRALARPPSRPAAPR